MSVLLKLKSISLSYRNMPVLRDCSAEIAPGITAVIGHNGSGKSTLLRACALLEEPTSGEVLYTGAEGNTLPHDMTLRRKLTLVLPRGGLFNASVLNNTIYGLKVRGIASTRRRELAMEALEAVGLAGLARQNALTLSSGEAQRLAIARGIAIRPEVLLLDEPTASVDEENTGVIEELILKLNKKTDATHHVPTIVLTTHDSEQCQRLRSRTLTMRKGTIVPSS